VGRAVFRDEFKRGKHLAPENGVTPILARIGDNGVHFLVRPRLVAAAKDELGNKIRRPPSCLVKRHAQSGKTFGVHITECSHRGSLLMIVNGLFSLTTPF
jgi:hypothetical protein